MEYDQGPAGSHPPAAVSSNHLVQVFHASFVVVIVQDVQEVLADFNQ